MIEWLTTPHWEFVGAVGIFVIALFILLPALGARLRYNRLTSSTVPVTNYSLSDPGMRDRLRDLLEAYNITGSCDIRDGKVFVTRSPGERDALAAALMNLYRRALDDINNPNLQLGYLKHGVFRPLGILDIDSLREIAEQLENRLAH